MLEENTNLDNFEDIDFKFEKNNYYSFVDKEELKKLFNEKIFLI